MNKIKWEKGYDFIDNSPRYSFENRDPSITVKKISVVIVQEDFFTYGIKEKYYVGYISHREKEFTDKTEKCRLLKNCKKLTLDLFKEYQVKFPEGGVKI